MDKVKKYQQIVETILTEHAENSASDDAVKPTLIFDRERHHYQLAYIGWQGHKRVFGPVMHFDILDGKIWIQYNGTEDAVAERLVKMGVSTSDIVLGLHSEFKRQFTPYAVG
ncbi:MAG: XisI protein [Cyanobacteria bacterium J06639_14]